MFIKVRRDTLIILILAFILILSGRAMTYVAFASSDNVDDGVPIAGVMVKGNDIVPLSSIKSNVAAAGFREGSYIKGNTLIINAELSDTPISEVKENPYFHSVKHPYIFINKVIHNLKYIYKI